MDNICVKVKKLDQGAVLPTYGSQCAAGADLYACLGGESVSIAPGQTVLVRTGIAIQIPDHTVALIYARSGLATKRGLAPANKVGVVDSDYRGEVMVALHNHSSAVQVVEDKERIAQLVVTPYYTAVFEQADLDDTARGEGGFGSTGK